MKAWVSRESLVTTVSSIDQLEEPGFLEWVPISLFHSLTNGMGPQKGISEEANSVWLGCVYSPECEGQAILSRAAEWVSKSVCPALMAVKIELPDGSTFAVAGAVGGPVGCPSPEGDYEDLVSLAYGITTAKVLSYPSATQAVPS